MIRRGLSPEARASLLGRFCTGGGAPAPSGSPARDFATLPNARELAEARRLGQRHNLSNPFFQPHDGVAGARTRIAGREMLNFASYNYLGLNGDPRVNLAAAEALALHGSSASASRMVSGERPVHAQLEAALARNYGAEEALVLVSGHATNVSVIGHLLGPDDLVVHDQLIHNSCAEGMRLSGARRVAFPHNDPEAAERALAGARARHKRALLLIEGHYSMDGTVPDLARFRDMARRHDAWLMVDEAHGLGCLGPTGRGVWEAQGVSPDAADIWMGTLSKTLASCGGFIAGSRALVDWLRHTLPGFVYSVGLPPPMAAAAECALRLMEEEPWRVERLQRNTRRFRAALQARGFDTGGSTGGSIVPVILGSSLRAVRLAEKMAAQGINVQPIAFPVVPEGQARLRFFLSSEHEESELDEAAEALGRAAREVAA
ncbi:aminotransferase class I/II-fold pyridoxal phosphate-dependent enzyme [Sabulicella glaciei]|uniref:Aminotransferase class I/II-fold pyridoxal phosphate-dependent enzyme n=1 Tax=Sabulicella glaciei TaxID=2984948 RepID=A0ABT3NX00_9PROT|nr:aminotransferase class I/II-fold pyridoxal phosphate-dependent enzyme [Roseococcus sp. MDT2-1-1]